MFSWKRALSLSISFRLCTGALPNRSDRCPDSSAQNPGQSVDLLMTTPAVGPIVALTYMFAIDDPKRFRSSKATGAHFGLTPRRYQSGETDYSGRITKVGDASVREALYQAAHIMLTKPVKNCSQLKSWAMRVARRAGPRKAKVALARKLAVILHRMLADNMPFNPAAKAAAT